MCLLLFYAYKLSPPLFAISSNKKENNSNQITYIAIIK